MKLSHIVAILLSGFIVVSALAAEPSSTAQLSMQLFLTACVPSNGSADRVEFAARKLKFTELTSTDAQVLLGGTTGRVWATGDVKGQWLIAAHEPNKCTIFVRIADAQELRNEFESWLPPPSTPFRFRKGADDASGQVQTLS